VKRSTYQSDLAYIHDAGYGNHARHAAAFLLDRLRENGIEDGRVVELGSGSGILARELCSAGYDVVGFDISGAMVRLARKNVPAARFHRQSLFTAKIPSCVAVTAVGEIFNYLFDETNTDETLTNVFARIHAALLPGGIFLFDVALPGRVPGEVLESHRQGKDWAALVTSREDRRQKTLVRNITSFRKLGKLYRRTQEVHHLRLFSRHDLAKQLRMLGFRLRFVEDGYGSLRFPAGYLGILAYK